MSKLTYVLRLARIMVLGGLVAFSVPCAQSQQKPGSVVQPPFSLTIKADEATVKSGSPVWVTAAVQNISGHPLTTVLAYFKDKGGYVYKVSAVNEKGASAPETKHGRRAQGHETPEEESRDFYVVNSSSANYTFSPGETMKDRVEVTKLFDLTTPGKYTIQFQEFDLDSNTMLKSNIVTVTVTPE